MRPGRRGRWEWGQEWGQQPLSCSRQAPPGRARGDVGQVTWDTGSLSGFAIYMGSPTPHAIPHQWGAPWRGWHHPGHILGILGALPLPRASLGWGFASLAWAGCGQRPDSGSARTSRGQPQRARSLGAPQPWGLPPPSLAGTPQPQGQLSLGGGDTLKCTQPHRPDTP